MPLLLLPLLPQPLLLLIVHHYVNTVAITVSVNVIYSVVISNVNVSVQLLIIIIIVTSFAPISSKIKLSGATKPGD